MTSEERLSLIRAGLAARHAREKRFRFLGIAAIVAALGFVVILFGMILTRGLPAFTQATLTLQVAFDPAIIKVEPKPTRQLDQSPADYRQELLGWERKVTMLNWNRIVEQAVRAAAPDTTADSRQVLSIVETNARFQLRDM